MPLSSHHPFKTTSTSGGTTSSSRSRSGSSSKGEGGLQQRQPQRLLVLPSLSTHLTLLKKLPLQPRAAAATTSTSSGTFNTGGAEEENGAVMGGHGRRQQQGQQKQPISTSFSSPRPFSLLLAHGLSALDQSNPSPTSSRTPRTHDLYPHIHMRSMSWGCPALYQLAMCLRRSLTESDPFHLGW